MSSTPPRPPNRPVLHRVPLCAQKRSTFPVLKFLGGLAVLGLAGSGVWWLKEHQPPPTGPAAQITVSVDPADSNILSAPPAPASTSPVVAAAASATVADPVLPAGQPASAASGSPVAPGAPDSAVLPIARFWLCLGLLSKPMILTKPQAPPPAP